MADKICHFETCNEKVNRGEKFCAQHNHILALQAELDRVKTLVPVDLRTLKAQFGPGLENLLSALARLAVCADPLKASAFGGGSPSARLKDAWAGQSMLGEGGNNVVTHRGAVDSSYARQVLIPRYRDKVGELAKEILDSVNPDLRPKTKVEKPRCGKRNCAWYDKRQNPEQTHCGKCGEPFKALVSVTAASDTGGEA